MRITKLVTTCYQICLCYTTYDGHYQMDLVVLQLMVATFYTMLVVQAFVL